MTRSSDQTDSMRIRRLRQQPPRRYRYVRLRWRVLFTVIDAVGAALFRIARQCIRLSIPWKKCFTAGQASSGTRNSQDQLFQRASSTSDPNRILLVQLDHLGDAILSTAMLPLLRRRYPAASIEVLAGTWNQDVFRLCPEVDRIHVSRINRFARGSLARLLWIPATFFWGLRLRCRHVDLGIDVRGEFPVALMLWLCGARRRLGWNAGGGGFLLTDSADFMPERPEVESRMALLAALGIEAPKTESLRPAMMPTPAARQRIAEQLAELPKYPSANRPLIVLHIGAGTSAKSWPVERWQELIGRLVIAHGARIILAGNGRDRDIANQILDGRVWPGVADWTGRLQLDQLAALLEAADVVVGADSGPAHLAAAVGTATVVLFSGTNNPRQWQPCGERVTVLRREIGCSPCHRTRCPRRGHPCMRLLRPRRVAAAVAVMLRRSADVTEHRTHAGALQ